MWSLHVAIHMKSGPKVKMYQREVGSCIAKNHLFMPHEVICGHYMSKVDQTRNWYKLKSVRTSIRIACFAFMCGHYI